MEKINSIRLSTKGVLKVKTERLLGIGKERFVSLYHNPQPVKDTDYMKTISENDILILDSKSEKTLEKYIAHNSEKGASPLDVIIKSVNSWRTNNINYKRNDKYLDYLKAKSDYNSDISYNPKERIFLGTMVDILKKNGMKKVKDESGSFDSFSYFSRTIYNLKGVEIWWESDEDGSSLYFSKPIGTTFKKNGNKTEFINLMQKYFKITVTNNEIALHQSKQK